MRANGAGAHDGKRLYLTDESGHRSEATCGCSRCCHSAVPEFVLANDAGLAWMGKEGLGMPYLIPLLTGAFTGKFAQKLVEPK